MQPWWRSGSEWNLCPMSGRHLQWQWSILCSLPSWYFHAWTYRKKQQRWLQERRWNLWPSCLLRVRMNLIQLNSWPTILFLCCATSLLGVSLALFDEAGLCSMVWGWGGHVLCSLQGGHVFHSPQGVMFSQLCSPNQVIGGTSHSVSLHCLFFLQWSVLQQRLSLASLLLSSSLVSFSALPSFWESKYLVYGSNLEVVNKKLQWFFFRWVFAVVSGVDLNLFAFFRGWPKTKFKQFWSLQIKHLLRWDLVLSWTVKLLVWPHVNVPVFGEM